MRKKIDVAGAENKTSAELKRIFPEFVLMMTGIMRSLSCFCIIAAQEMQEIGGLQLRCAIGLTLFVYEERESDGGFLAKLPGINGITEPNCRENCAFLAKGLFVFAQLRDVLTAKDSAVVTQENYDGRSFIPQGSEPRLAVVAVRKRDKGELIAEGSIHHRPSCAAHLSLSSAPLPRSFTHFLRLFTYSLIGPCVVLRWRTEEIISTGASDDFKIPSNYRRGGESLSDQSVLTSLPAPTQDERTMAFLAHLLQVFTGFIAPLVIYCVKQDSHFVKFHALQSLIWQLCYMALFFGAMIVFFFSIFATVFSRASGGHTPNGPPPAFFVVFPVFWMFWGLGWVANVVLGIVYGLKANRGEWAGYPIIGKWCLPKSVPSAPPLSQS